MFALSISKSADTDQEIEYVTWIKKMMKTTTTFLKSPNTPNQLKLISINFMYGKLFYLKRDEANWVKI